MIYVLFGLQVMFHGCRVPHFKHLANIVHQLFVHSFHSIHSLTCAECDDSLSFSAASSIPLCCELFPSTLFHQIVFCPSSLRLAIYFSIPVSLVVSKFIHNTFLGILFSSILCTYPNQHNIFSLLFLLY